ncbi:MAG: hypothetical protein WAM58_07020 [Candidatus Acidiferrum sp.]
MQNVLGSPLHISGDKSTIAPAAPPTERAACLQIGGVHAQRREGNIHRSLPASTMSKPWVSAADLDATWGKGFFNGDVFAQVVYSAL